MRVPGTTGPGDPRITAAARKLVLTEDFAVRQKLVRYVRGRLERFVDAELAAQIATKRLGDYQQSLERRNVRGMDAPGTYGWILHQQRANAGRLDRSQFDELLVAARSGARRALEATMSDEPTAAYVLDGQIVASGWVWRRLFGRRAG